MKMKVLLIAYKIILFVAVKVEKLDNKLDKILLRIENKLPPLDE